MPPVHERSAAELRVHGVGGDPTHVVLGLPYPTDVRTAARVLGRDAVITSKHDPNAFAYVWGELTSGSPFYAMWTLVLPFTLANVAGWMHPPVRTKDGVPSAASQRRVASIRILVFLSGLVLTIAAVTWAAALAIAWAGFPTGAAITAFVVLLAFAGALWGAASYELSEPLSSGKPVVHPLRRPASLADPAFFDGKATLVSRLGVHALAAGLACVGVLVSAGRADRPVAQAGLWSVRVTALGFVVVAVLFVASFQRRFGPGSLRWSGSATVAGAAHLVLAGAASAGLVAFASGREGEFGPALALFDAFAVAFGVGALVLVVVVVAVLARRCEYEITDRPAREQYIGSRAAAKASRRAQLIRNLDVPLSAFVLVATVGVIVEVARNWSDLESWVATGDTLRGVALIALVPLFGFVVRDLRRNFMSIDRRRKVGQLWDVMAFWPRSFHPLGVRPYSERAVPELVAVLTNATSLTPRRWIVTAHSQGSVLAATALTQMGDQSVDAVPVDLITFGSPLRNLYAKAFPAYFDDAFLRALQERQDCPGSWVNFWRATDPVGREMFSDAFLPPPAVTDVHLKQPNETTPARVAWATSIEQDPPLGSLDAHSGYRRTQELKAAVRAAADRSETR